MTDLLDSYPETNWSCFTALEKLHPSNTDLYSAAGQSFTSPPVPYRIESVKFWLNKYGSPTGTAHAELYAHTGTYGTTGKPTGSALAQSDGFDISTLTTTYQLITFTFTGAQQYLMTPNTYYCIVCVGPTAGFLAEATDYVRVGEDSAGPTHGGVQNAYNNSAWQAFLTVDTLFYLYGSDSEYTHVDHNAFKNLAARLGMTRGNPSLSVTRHNLYLGTTRDTVTGWYPPSYYETTIDAVIIPKASQGLALSAGYYVSLDAVGFTHSRLKPGDLLADASGRHFEVKGVMPNTIGDTLYFYVSDLKELPYHGA